MDEPLSNLDAKLRNRMRFELRRLHEQHGTTTVYVTHDQVEAMTLADRMAVLNAGKLQQVDAPLEVYRNPANAFVAGFIGSPPMNLIEGEAKDGVLQVGGTSLALPEHLAGSRGEGSLGIRPEDIDVVSEGGVPSRSRAKNIWVASAFCISTSRGNGCVCELILWGKGMTSSLGRAFRYQ